MLNARVVTEAGRQGVLPGGVMAMIEHRNIGPVMGYTPRCAIQKSARAPAVRARSRPWVLPATSNLIFRLQAFLMLAHLQLGPKAI
jgi:hypothetical protein